VIRSALLRDRALLALLAREVLSLTGTNMTWVALPWFVLTTTGSATRMSLVVAVEAASLAVAGFAAGNLATRVGPRRTMLVADACRAPLIALVPLLHVVGLLSFPLLLTLVFAHAAFSTPSFAAKQTLLPDLVGEDEANLAEANALLQAANRLAIVAGPALAGALIGFVGATTVLLVDAATFVGGFALIALFVRTEAAPPAPEDARGLTAGLRFLLRDRLLGPWSAAIIVSDVVFLALFTAVPVLVVTRFGEQPQLVGWILAGFGAGAVAGSAIAFRIVRRVDRLLLGSVGEIAMVLPLWLLLPDLPAAAPVGAMVAVGFVNGLINAPIHTIFQLRTPRALCTKAWTAIVSLTSLLAPFVLVLVGPALDHVGLSETLVALLLVQSAACLVFCASGLRARAAGERLQPGLAEV
jgi:MFS family permease